jgi:outer membrane protein TolC
MRLCLLSILIVAGVFAQQQDSLTIDKAVDIVLKRHPSITQAQEALEASRAHTQGLTSANYPSVNATVSDVYLGPEYPFNLGGLKFAMFPDNNFDAHIGATYTVYDFGKRSMTLEAGKTGEKSASDQLQSVKTQLYYQVLQLFTSIILQEKSVTVADEGIAELDRHLVDVRKKIEAGSATEFDALKTQVQLTGAQGQRIDIASDMAKKKTALGQLLGFTPAASLDLKGGFDTLPARLNVDSLISYALDNRSERALAVNARQSAKIQREIAKKENLPVLNIHASGGFKNGFPDTVAPPRTDISTPRINWSAGAEVSIPLYDGKRAHFHEQEAARNEMASNAALNTIDERIKTEVLQAKEDVEASFSKLDISQAQITFAQRSLELARLKYDAGVVTNLDVLDAENDFSQAKLGHLRNQYQYTQSIYALDKAIGRMPFTLPQ